MGILFGGPTPEDGKSAYELWLEEGHTGSPADYQNWLKGADGISAYQVAVDNGFSGTVTAWLTSLKGDDGLSAYQVWLADGNTGTQTDFLNWLRADMSSIGNAMDWNIGGSSPSNVDVSNSWGKYVRIGKMVIIQASIRLSSSASSGFWQIDLPFVSINSGQFRGEVISGGGLIRNGSYSVMSGGARISGGSESVVTSNPWMFAACYISA